jgi:hypothetical protein
MSVRFVFLTLALGGALLATACDSVVDADEEGGEELEGERQQPPLTFAECSDRQASSCSASEPLCATVDGPGGGGNDGSFFTWWSFCTRECQRDSDCRTSVEGGTARARCRPWQNTKVCVLDCSFGRTCPEGLGGCTYSGTCGHQQCSCTGDEWCADPLCAQTIP